jgi:hypothetical protein
MSALCAYSCKTMEEARMKVEYLAAVAEFSPELWEYYGETLMLSFLPQVDDDAAHDRGGTDE